MGWKLELGIVAALIAGIVIFRNQIGTALAQAGSTVGGSLGSAIGGGFQSFLGGLSSPFGTPSSNSSSGNTGSPDRAASQNSYANQVASAATQSAWWQNPLLNAMVGGIPAGVGSLGNLFSGLFGGSSPTHTDTVIGPGNRDFADVQIMQNLPSIGNPSDWNKTAKSQTPGLSAVAQVNQDVQNANMNFAMTGRGWHFDQASGMIVNH